MNLSLLNFMDIKLKQVKSLGFTGCNMYEGDAWHALYKHVDPKRRTVKVHMYSWDSMGRCVKDGICQVTDDHKSSGGISPSDFEISAKG